MKESRLSQNAWARRLGLSRAYLSQLINGRRLYPGRKVRRKLLGGLGLSFQELFEVEPEGAEMREPSERPRVCLWEFEAAGICLRMERKAAHQAGNSRGGTRMANWWYDLRQGIRGAVRKPSFTLAAVVTVALGVGANTALFSVVHGVLLRPWIYKQPERVVLLSSARPQHGWDGMPLPSGALEDLRQSSRALQQASAYREDQTALQGGSEPLQVLTAEVSPSLFSLLGVRPMLGRTFPEGEDSSGSVLISHRLWQSSFGGDPDILHKVIRLGESACSVAGVMPPGFQFPHRQTDVWTPMAASAADWENWKLRAAARMAPSATLEQVRSELQTRSRGYAQDGHWSEGWVLEADTLPQSVVGKVRNWLLLLSGGAGLVLLIVAANLANLMLMRAASRRREWAVRSVLGAGRRRLFRQVLSENLIYSLLGGACSLLLSYWIIQALQAFSPADLPRRDEIAVDGAVLAFALGISLLTGLLGGLLPALHISRQSLVEPLKSGGRTLVGGGWPVRLRQAFAVAQVAVAATVLVGAGLLLRSYQTLMSSERGFQSEGVLTLQLELPKARYPEAWQRFDFFSQLRQEAAALPMVESVGLTTGLPTSGVRLITFLSAEGSPPQPESEKVYVAGDIITPGYLETLKVHLLEGRFFNPGDDGRSQGAVILNQKAARHFFPDGNVLGKRIREGKQGPWLTVVGVVGSIRQYGLGQEAPLHFYRPLGQASAGAMHLMVRAADDPIRLAESLKHRIWQMDADLPVIGLRTLDEVVQGSVSERRYQANLLTGFALLALVLSTVGLYAVISYGVSRRTREFGVHRALGARPGDILKSVLGQSARVAGLGLLLGLGAALGLSRLLSGLLFEISPADPWTYFGIALLLTVVTMSAGAFPARRASRVDPLQALRCE